jgi:hypothetical protein
MRDRQRRYRARMKAGLRVFSVEADPVDIEVLEEAGYSLAEVVALCA